MGMRRRDDAGGRGAEKLLIDGSEVNLEAAERRGPSAPIERTMENTSRRDRQSSIEERTHANGSDVPAGRWRSSPPVPTMRAAPDQTARPGDMTEAKVVDSEPHPRRRDCSQPARGRHRDAAARAGREHRFEPAFGEGAGSIRTQPLRQEWDYDTVVIVPDTNPMQALKPLGLAGWETTGVSWTNAQGAMTLLLKRPR